MTSKSIIQCLFLIYCNIFLLSNSKKDCENILIELLVFILSVLSQYLLHFKVGKLAKTK